MTVCDQIDEQVSARFYSGSAFRAGAPDCRDDGETLEETAQPTIAVIEPRVLFGQCLLSALRALDPDSLFNVYPDLENWERATTQSFTDLVLLCIQCGESADATVAMAERDFSLLRTGNSPRPFVVMSDQESPELILKALNEGASGFIPTSLSLEVAVQVLQLVRAGGVFVPASSLVALASNSQIKQVPADESGLSLSARQLSVAKALRRGMPNKLIAYELNMCESTVKVHVRTIMKKLKARNRTEAALLTSRFFPGEDV